MITFKVDTTHFQNSKGEISTFSDVIKKHGAVIKAESHLVDSGLLEDSVELYIQRAFLNRACEESPEQNDKR